jgi:2',3'-cyclic-nucleotide 2'-phosphodiesterase (5'-nucleotidase family)
MKLHVVLLHLVIALALRFSQADAQEHKLTILHTNDMHASFVPHEAFWVKTVPKPMVGGFTQLARTVDSIRTAVGTSLLLDAGDVMTGNPITEMEYSGAYGGALIAMMNRIGYDAWCPGNHDLDISQENLAKLAAIARYPMVCANVEIASGKRLAGAKPYVVIERGGFKIGVIGIMSQELYSLVNQNNLVGIKVNAPDATLQRYVDELKSKTDIIIALTHQGADEDSVLATKVSGVSIIVGGHSHTRLRRPREVNGVIIVQAGSNCENLGQLDLTIANGKVTSYDGHLNQLWLRDGKVPAVASLVDSMQVRIDKEYSEVLGVLEEDWVRRNAPSGVGTFIAEAQREAAAAEVGFMNNAGIRKDVSAGPITKKDLFEVLPFRNVLVTFELSGAQLKDILRYYVQEKPSVQITGLSARWKRSADGTIRITTADVLGKPLEESRMYKCAASDYFVGEAKRYLGVEVLQPYFLHQTVFEAVEKAVRETKQIRNTIPYRIAEGE